MAEDSRAVSVRGGRGGTDRWVFSVSVPVVGCVTVLPEIGVLPRTWGGTGNQPGVAVVCGRLRPTARCWAPEAVVLRREHRGEEGAAQALPARALPAGRQVRGSSTMLS